MEDIAVNRSQRGNNNNNNNNKSGTERVISFRDQNDENEDDKTSNNDDDENRDTSNDGDRGNKTQRRQTVFQFGLRTTAATVLKVEEFLGRVHHSFWLQLSDEDQ